MGPDQSARTRLGLEASRQVLGGEQKQFLPLSSFTPRGKLSGLVSTTRRANHKRPSFKGELFISAPSPLFPFSTSRSALSSATPRFKPQASEPPLRRPSPLYHLRCIPLRASCQPGSFAASKAPNAPRNILLPMANPRRLTNFSPSLKRTKETRALKTLRKSPTTKCCQSSTTKPALSILEACLP
jgi:hypothetical protein